MAITVHLSSAWDRRPTPSPSHISIKLQIAIMPPRLGELGSINFSSIFAPIQGGQIPFGHRQQISFPALGLSSSTLIEVPYQERSLTLFGQIIIPSVSSKPIEFAVSTIGADDDLAIFALSHRTFAGNILHRTAGVKHDSCMVFCADGKSSQTCIICEHKNASIKICC